MKLRKLENKDIPGMLEWMHDPEINRNFRIDFSRMTAEKVTDFIATSFTEDNRHYAIADDADEYLGTASLKSIDREDKTAEYAITMRKSSLGTGVAGQAVKQLLHIAHDELALEKVYANILEENMRSRRFNEKMGFEYEGCFKNHIIIRGESHNLCWYAHFKKADNGVGEKAQLVELQQRGDERGHLVVVEGLKDVPFDIKRVFYIYGSDAAVVRGQHANRKTKFMLINVSGKSKVRVDYGDSTEVFDLNKSHVGLYIPQMIWKDMYDFSPDSVLLVLASEVYDAGEYIRDKELYYQEIGAKK